MSYYIKIMNNNWKIFLYVIFAIAKINVVSPLPADFFAPFNNNCTARYEEARFTHKQLLTINRHMIPRANSIFIFLYRYEKLPLRFPLTSAANQLLESPSFNVSLPVVLYFPGLLEYPVFPSIFLITRNLMQTEKANVLHVDASVYLGVPFYILASMATRYVGEHVGRMLADLSRGCISAEKIHLIGFSLGAHNAGFAGKIFRKLTGKKIGRISGLDPAGMCFYDNPPNLRLDRSDANFVDIIHTSAGFWGINETLGHVDFYPNGGSRAASRSFTVLNHQYAYFYYAESILSPKKFIAAKCKSWKLFLLGKCYQNPRSYMGFKTSPKIRGVYYLRTRIIPPFGLGSKSIPQNVSQQVFFPY